MFFVSRQLRRSVSDGEVGEDALEDLISMLAERFPSVVGERNTKKHIKPNQAREIQKKQLHAHHHRVFSAPERFIGTPPSHLDVCTCCGFMMRNSANKRALYMMHPRVLYHTESTAEHSVHPGVTGGCET